MKPLQLRVCSCREAFKLKALPMKIANDPLRLLGQALEWRDRAAAKLFLGRAQECERLVRLSIETPPFIKNP
jgi:hypothetical protein